MTDRFRYTVDQQALNRLGAGGLTEERAKALVEGMARLFVDGIRDEMEEAPPRTGRQYNVPGTQTKYTASAPGEPPAVREGRYRDSWEATKGVAEGKRVFAAAASSLATDEGELIGLLLEDGTSRMAPRPHVREGMLRAEPACEDLLRGSGR